MWKPYLNVQEEEPARMHSSLSTAFRSMTQSFLSHAPEQDEELASPYYSGIRESEYNLQEAFQQQSTFGHFVSSLLGGKWGLAGEEPTADEQPEKRGFIHSLTPQFLRSDGDEDFASACCPRLGFKQRLFGCACCFALGQVMQFCSFGAAAGILIGRPGRFACLYTLGNLVMVAASFFLSGPRAQCRKIKAKDRALTSFIYFSTMFLTLAAVFARPFVCRSIVILLLVVVQWLALVWYVLSYIPYGHTTGKRVLKSLGRWLWSF